VLPLRDDAPTRSFPLVTIGIIAGNFAVWAWELHARASQVDHYAFYPCSISGPCLGAASSLHQSAGESVFTAMFLHASWAHILGNMLFLWIFGNNVEDSLGRVRFVWFYLASGLVATAGQTFVTLHYAATLEASVPTLGASGAISGVLGAYFLLLPRARVLTLIGIFPVRIPAILFLGFWFALELYEADFSLTHPSSGGGVAFFAHVAGFAFGFLSVKVLAKRPPLGAR
jgi:membrane associated rhomboid family serine protease